MGLPNRLHDASSDSIPILLVVAAAGWVSYLRSLLLCLLHSLGLQRLHPSSAAADDPLFSAAGSGLAGLVVVASSGRPFAYEALPSAAAEGERDEPGCVVCLCELADGDRLRRLDLSNRFMKALHLFKVMQLEKSAKPIGLVDEGCRYFVNMSKVYGVQPEMKHYGCMVDLLIRAGLLEEAEGIVRSMTMKPDVMQKTLENFKNIILLSSPQLEEWDLCPSFIPHHPQIFPRSHQHSKRLRWLQV
ncbi:pentatricopeptide repeat-containing protein At2g25580-like isoform X1 [Phoenix dactylifera]|uniref:Pentatricopeptide repeat-containing protein At2g25580-like isoform X1 n=1 Tax=Phoenix dactylifera TaxID=42345 RepID=A0A8B8ZLZ0_PHODC|nr:pentatricopeptide repeat-containing protein At2g25580-like isoform X1 [Phoenix dactylifera]